MSTDHRQAGGLTSLLFITASLVSQEFVKDLLSPPLSFKATSHTKFVEELNPWK